jgi:hypothetical protein
MSFGTPALVSRYAAQPESVKNSGYITNIFFGFLLKFDKYNYNKSIKGLENKKLFFLN